MSFTIKFIDLLNLSLGTPEPGVVNFNALRILLQGIIEHLNLSEQKKVLPGNEKDYINPFQKVSLPKSLLEMPEEKSIEGILSRNLSGKVTTDFGRRLSAVEKQIAFLETLPTTKQLLERSQPLKTPAQDMWQMLQLKKKVEGNEEGMTKAMNTLQELLTTIYSLQSDIDNFRIVLEELKEKAKRMCLEEVNKQFQELKDQQDQVKNLQNGMEDVKNMLRSFPDKSDIMQWTTLHDAMFPQADTEKIPKKTEAETEKELQTEGVGLGTLQIPSMTAVPPYGAGPPGTTAIPPYGAGLPGTTAIPLYGAGLPDTTAIPPYGAGLPGITPDEATLAYLGPKVDPSTLKAVILRNLYSTANAETPSQSRTSSLFPSSTSAPTPSPTVQGVLETIPVSETPSVPESSTLPDTKAGKGPFLTSPRIQVYVPKASPISGKAFKQVDLSLSKEDKKLIAKNSISNLISLPLECDSLKEQMTKLEDKVQQQAVRIVNLEFVNSLGLPSKLETEMSALQKKISKNFQESGQKNKNYEQNLEKMRENYDALEKVTENLQNKVEDIKDIQNVLRQLEIKKADKIEMEEQMREKADKSALAFKANRADLDLAIVQLSEMMGNMMKKMSINKHDWQKVLHKLFIDVDSKLGHMDLDPMKKQMKQIWKVIKKHLSESAHFDGDGAAGFRKQLFERVKCISCDRPVTMMTCPQMITIRRANMISRLRPASANTFEYLQRLKLKEQMQQLEPNKETTNPPEQTIMSTEGQTHLDDNSLRKTNGKPPPNLTTFYPYGNPSPLTPGNAEVNIQGVDGVMYKGRMGSYGALRPINPEKDVTGLKVPRPPSPRSGYERGHYNMPAIPSRTSMTTQPLKQIASHGRPTSKSPQNLPSSSLPGNQSAPRPTPDDSTFRNKASVLSLPIIPSDERSNM